ncbi:hypothetical protein EBT25_10210 [bacterium]|nr:hypothetical protein [bacterium]
MDRFLNLIQQKPKGTLFAPGTLTCLYGRPGSGKTTLLKNEFQTYISIDAEVLKTKQGTLDLLERLKGTHVPIVIDDWESVCELIGVREIQGPISPKSPTVIVAHTPVKHTQHTLLYECPYKEDFRRSVLDAQGNSTPDVFESPKDYVHRLLRGEWKDVRVGDVTHEHGHVWSIVQENYPDRVSGNVETMCTIAQLMSDADLIDTEVYENSDWNVVMPLFTMVSCLVPCKLMTPSKAVPRTGSFWTKFQNMCMRRKKLETMFRRSNLLTREALDIVIRVQFLKGDYSACKEYLLEPSDIDVLGHFIGPFKPKIISAAKKSCG